MRSLPQIGDANWGPKMLAYLQEQDRRVKILCACSALQAVATIILGLAVLLS